MNGPNIHFHLSHSFQKGTIQARTKNTKSGVVNVLHVGCTCRGLLWYPQEPQLSPSPRLKLGWKKAFYCSQQKRLQHALGCRELVVLRSISLVCKYAHALPSIAISVFYKIKIILSYGSVMAE